MKKLSVVFCASILFYLGACSKKEVEPPTLTLSTNSIDLGAITSSSTANLSLSLNGEGTISYTIASNKNWLKVSKVGGTVSPSDILTLSTLLTATDLTEGDNTATLSITPTINGVVSPMVTVSVKGAYKTTTLTVASNVIDFGIIKATKSVYLKMSKAGLESLSYEVASDKDWLTIEKAAGTLVGTDSLKFTANISTMPAGVQTANVSISPKANGITGKPITVAVKVEYDDTITGDIEGRTLTKNETWSGNINLNGSIIVPLGRTLTIKPGTTITARTVAPNRLLTEIKAYGTLIMHGTPSAIITIKAPKSTDMWYGLRPIGDFEMSYCCIKDGYYAIDFYDNATLRFTSKPIIIHHCLFDNCWIGINSFNSKYKPSLYNLTFRNLKNDALAIDFLPPFTLSKIEFLSEEGADVSQYANDLSSLVEDSNFIKKKLNTQANIWLSSFYDPYNNTVVIKNCFGTPTGRGFGVKGNTLTITTPATASHQNIGCGFLDKFPNMAIGVDSPLRDKQLLQQYEERMKIKWATLLKTQD